MTEQEKIQILQDIIRIQTIAANEKEVADYLAKLFKKYDIPTQEIIYSEGRSQLIATLEGTEKGATIGLCGHMDVVPIGDAPWKFDPFSAQIDDGKMYGRGASDMKGGLVACALALIKIKEDNTPFAGTIRFIATVGEETAAIGAGKLVKDGHAEGLDALVIAEPSGLQVMVAHKGALWVRFTTYGKTAHGSMPQLGINAIEHMRLLVDEFNKRFDFSKATNPMLGTSTASLNLFQSGKQTNVIPDRCVTEFDIRTVPVQDHSKMVAEFNAMLTELAARIPDFKAEVEVINDLPPIHTNESDKLVKLALEIGSDLLKTELQPTFLPGYTDASQFIKGNPKLPIIVFGPGQGNTAHQTDEYITVESYLQGIEALERVALGYLK